MWLWRHSAGLHRITYVETWRSHLIILRSSLRDAMASFIVSTNIVSLVWWSQINYNPLIFPQNNFGGVTCPLREIYWTFPERSHWSSCKISLHNVCKWALCKVFLHFYWSAAVTWPESRGSQRWTPANRTKTIILPSCSELKLLQYRTR